MSLPLLIECANETRRLAVAGSQLAVGDFRLQRLIEPLEKSGEKAAVFKAVARATRNLVEGSEKESPRNLLQLSTLVNAILYTQGQSEVKGQLKPIETEDLGFTTNNTSARVMKPLIEALTTTGGGRHDTIRQAFERGAFRDIRLMKLAVQGIDDVYSELADYMAETVVPSYGKAIVPLIAGRVKLGGDRGDARRLGLLHRLAPAKAHPIAKRALEEKSSALVKVAAIEALAEDEDCLPLVLEHTKGGAQEVRAAALKAIALHDRQEVVDLLIEALRGKDIDRAAEAIARSKSKQLAEVLLEEADGQLTALLDPKHADAEMLKKVKGREAAHVYSLLRCFLERTDDETRFFLLRCFEGRKTLGKLKGKGSWSGSDVFELLVTLLATLRHDDASDALLGALSELDAFQLGQAFVSAAHTKPAAFVYDTFSPLMKGLQKASGKAKDKAEELARILSWEEDTRGYGYGYYGSYHYYHGYGWRRPDDVAGVEIDPRWLDLGLEHGHVGIVARRITPGHAEGIAFLEKEFASAKKGETALLLNGLIRAEAPGLEEDAVSAIEKTFKKGTYYWERWTLVEVLRRLPVRMVPALERVAQTLPDNAVDQLIDTITHLRRQANEQGVKLPATPAAPAQEETPPNRGRKAAAKKKATPNRGRKAAAKKKATKKKATKKKPAAKKKATKKKPAAKKKATKKKATKKKPAAKKKKKKKKKKKTK